MEDLWSYWEQAIATKGREGRSDGSQSFYSELALSFMFLLEDYLDRGGEDYVYETVTE